MLLIGFVFGLWHAFDLDHVGAMIAFVASGDSSRGQAVKYSLLWATGHALMLLLMTLLVMAMHVDVSGQLASIMEFMVGAMLVVLALDAFRRIRSMKMHSHQHLHGGDEVHEHLHVHRRSEVHAHRSHMHAHDAGDHYPLRALFVGLMHGLAGSAALTIIMLSTATSVGMSILYVLIFSLGAMAGMVLLSMFIAMQLRRTANGSLELATRLRSGGAIVVLSVGLFMMTRTGLELV